MTGKSKIEWTDAVWNPVVGCSVVSPGCENCYAATMDRRIRAIAGEEYRPWTAPNAAYNVRLHPERLEAPLRWRLPRRVFVNSMSDLFHENVPDEFILDVWLTMAMARQHTFQVLTKRPERMRSWVMGLQKLPGGHKLFADDFWPLPNVWLGVSVEDQRRADERVPLLLQTPAAVRFLSCEPLLGPVELRPEWLFDECPRGCGCRLMDDADRNDCACDGPCCDGDQWFDRRSLIDWVIVGGESGPGARSCDVGWIRGIVAQCKAAGVACFVKQLGAKPFDGMEGLRCDGEPHLWAWLYLKSRKGDRPEEWPEDLCVREFPAPAAP